MYTISLITLTVTSIERRIPLITTLEGVKYLRTNLTKKVKDLHETEKMQFMQGYPVFMYE